MEAVSGEARNQAMYNVSVFKKSFKNDFQTDVLQKYLLFDSQSIDRIMKNR